MKDGIVTIDINALILEKDKAGSLTLTPTATQELAKILKAKEMIEKLYEHVQGVLSQRMAENNLKKIVSDNIVVRNSMYGEKYVITEETDPQYTKTNTFLKPNAETIDKYIEAHGEPPPGVTLKERLPKATIKFRDE